jgi:hypothetical protein
MTEWLRHLVNESPRARDPKRTFSSSWTTAPSGSKTRPLRHSKISDCRHERDAWLGLVTVFFGDSGEDRGAEVFVEVGSDEITSRHKQ